MTINPITKIMNDLTDEELVIIIKEIREADKTGTFTEASDYRNLIKNICGSVLNANYSSFMALGMTLVFKEFAYRKLMLK